MAKKVKIDDDLYDKLRRCAEAAGYSSTEEFVIHVLEREIDRVLGDEEDLDEEKVKERLRGLGYLA